MLGVRTGDLTVRRREEFRRGPRETESVPAVVCWRDRHRRQPCADASGQTYGADFRLATSQFLGGPRNFVRERLRPCAAATKASRAMTGRTAFPPAIRTTSATRRWRCARSSRTSTRRSASCSATTCACSGWPAATTRVRGIPQRAADVPRCLLHALHAARQRRGRELGPLHDDVRLALELRRLIHGLLDVEPDSTSGCSSRSRFRPVSCCPRVSTASRASRALSPTAAQAGGSPAC